MTLQGSLQQLGLAGVLQNALAGRSGTLHLRNGTARAVLYVDSHQLRLIEPDTVDPQSLLDGFLHRGLVTTDVFEQALNAREDARGIIEYLVETGAIARPELDSVLRGAAEDTILELLTWDDGDFRFQEGEEADETTSIVSQIGADMGGILLRAAQRLDERNAIAAGLGTQPHLFLHLERVPTPENGGDPVAQIHALLDGHRVVSEIALLAGTSRFAALRAVLTCVKDACARAATPDELRAAAEAREAQGQHRVARDLLMQWAGADPGATEPLERLAALAHQNGKPEEEADALLTLGHVHLQHGNQELALPILLQLVKRRPGDTNALSALSTAAEAVGQLDLFAKTVLQLAEAALEEDEPEQAASILTRLVSMPDAPIESFMLRGRAFVRLRDRERLVAEAEAAHRAIGGRATTRSQMEAATFFGDAIANLAPERSSLLRDFRRLTQGRKPKQRVAILIALLCLLATIGFVLWPKSAASILDEALAAEAAGDHAEAARLVGVLAEAYPDSMEASEGYLLQARLQSSQNTPRPKQTAAIENEALEAAVTACILSLPTLPAPEALAQLEHLATLLEAPENRRSRQAVVDRLEEPLVEVGKAIVRDVRERVDRLGRAPDLAAASKHDIEALNRYLEELSTWYEPEHPDRLAAVCKVLDRVVGEMREGDVGRTLRLVQKSTERLARAWKTGAQPLADCRLRHTGLELEELQAACRTDASRLLVSGRIDEAAAMYRLLAERIETIKADPNLHPLLEQIAEDGTVDFLKARQSTISEIDHAMQSARASEEAGDLESAVQAYLAVTKKFWHVRFEGVIELPLRIRAVPEGARVRLNGESAGITPLVLHYAWGSQITLTIEADGFETVNRLLVSDGEDPSSAMDVFLIPKRDWSAPLESTVVAPPVGVRGDVLVATRSGRVTRHAKEDGKVRWARHVDSLEGMRARPAVSGGIVYLPHLDGKLWFLDAEDGRPLGSLDLRRPAVDPAALDDRVAIATHEGRLQILLRKKLEAEVPLDGRPTAGVLAAHDAFWVGLADGQVARVQANGSRHRVTLPGRRVPVIGITAFAGGVVVSKGDGTLHTLDAGGQLLWSVEAVGDIVGDPAVAGGTVAAIDSRARILLFDLEDGSPRGQVDLESAARHGLVAVNGCLVASLGEGRLWIHDPVTDRTLTDVSLGGIVQFAPASVGDGRLAVPVKGGRFTVLTVPAAATEGR